MPTACEERSNPDGLRLAAGTPATRRALSTEARSPCMRQAARRRPGRSVAPALRRTTPVAHHIQSRATVSSFIVGCDHSSTHFNDTYTRMFPAHLLSSSIAHFPLLLATHFHSLFVLDFSLVASCALASGSPSFHPITGSSVFRLADSAPRVGGLWTSAKAARVLKAANTRLVVMVWVGCWPIMLRASGSHQALTYFRLLSRGRRDCQRRLLWLGLRDLLNISLGRASREKRHPGT